MRFRQGTPQQQHPFSEDSPDFSKKSDSFGGVPPPLLLSQLSADTDSPQQVANNQVVHELVNMYGGGKSDGSNVGFSQMYSHNGGDDVRAGSGAMMSGSDVDFSVRRSPPASSSQNQQPSAQKLKIKTPKPKSVQAYRTNLQLSKEMQWEQDHPLDLDALTQSQQQLQQQIQYQSERLPQQQQLENQPQVLGTISGDGNSSSPVSVDEDVIEEALRDELQEEANAKASIVHEHKRLRHTRGHPVKYRIRGNADGHYRFRQLRKSLHGHIKKKQQTTEKKPRSVAHSDGKGLKPTYDNSKVAFRSTHSKLLPLAWHGWLEQEQQLKRYSQRHH